MHPRRPAPFLATVLAVLVLAAMVATAVPAGAATTAALHPLGARAPRHTMAVRHVAGVSALTTPLPASVNLRNYAVPVGNQGAVGSCVAWAIDYGMLGWYTKKAGRVGQPFAPMFVYSQINGGADNGSYPTDAFALLQSLGSDTQAHYSHNNFDWWDKPNDAEKAYAGHYKISGYQTLFMGTNQAGSANAIKIALAANHPVAITLPVRPGFDNMGHTATSVDNDTTGAIRGYHEVLALGYDAAGLVIQNSWGTYWGAAGFGKLSWNVVNRDVAEADFAYGLAADDAAPAMLTVTAAPLATGSIGADTVPYKVSWTSLGAVARYTVTYSADGGAAVPVTLTNVKAPSYTFNATPGVSYQFSVQATDALARTSAPMTANSFTAAVAQESDSGIVYGGIWTSTPVAAASGGAVKLTTRLNATATFTTNARTISWIASKGTNRGSAKVMVDGVQKATVNLYATVTANKVIAYTIDFGTTGSHTIQIVDLGTLGHSGVDVDAFVVTS
jgi:hypothetical protein